MDPFEFLQKFQLLQYKEVTDLICDLGFAKVNYSKEDQSAFCNFALVNKILTTGELSQIEQKMRELKRHPAIYFENRTDLQPLKVLLTKKRYVRDYEDAWMFHGGEGIIQNRFDQIKEVLNEEDLQNFLATFNACYRADDPQNPYGEVKSWLPIIREAWYRHHRSGNSRYFMALKGGKPVAVAGLKSGQGIGYISDVGSLPEVRGEGFGKLVTLYSVYVSLQHGNKLHSLATEDGTYPHEFYERIGFKTKFTAVCYKK